MRGRCRSGNLAGMPRLQVEGAELHYEDTGGGGTPVVFAHGLLWSGTMYRFQIEALRGEHRCISFDFRGQGRSPVADSGYDMDTLARDAARLIEKLRAAPCHFVGLSMGGFIGMRLALRRPELLRTLTLLETAADPEPALNKPKYALMGLITRALGTRALVTPIMKIMFGRTFLRDPSKAALRESLKRELLENDVRGMLLALRGVLARKGVMDGLPSIRTPTLVLSGEEDVAVRPERSRQTAERIPGAKFKVLPRAGHTSSMEQPEAVTAALREFFGSV
jgi:3-oxoadipate enol-lactonase